MKPFEHFTVIAIQVKTRKDFKYFFQVKRFSTFEQASAITWKFWTQADEILLAVVDRIV